MLFRLVDFGTGLGRIDGGPTDLSSVSEMTGVPRSTLHRKAKLLEEAGFIKLQREGRRVLLISTMPLASDRDDFQDHVDELIRTVRQNVLHYEEQAERRLSVSA